MISDLQVKALADLDAAGGRGRKTWDGRLTFPLRRRGLIRCLDDGLYEITDVGREILRYERSRAGEEIPATATAILERIRAIPLPDRLRPRPVMRLEAAPSIVPELPPPADDGMLAVCCAPAELAVAARALRRSASGGELYVVSADGRHWPVAFCPFCGAERGDPRLLDEGDEES